MRSLDETKRRWEETLRQNTAPSDLQRGIKFDNEDGPCVAGCRSICWKKFLLFRTADASQWVDDLAETRSAYTTLSDHYLRYLRQPELLNEITLDPLADDPTSPWETLRQDEVLRAEILQDVLRLPDEAFYKDSITQAQILDILFIWCKVNPDANGYRQGMHELVAPLLFVVAQDTVDHAQLDTKGYDPIMLDMLDSRYTQHDCFALFSQVMDKAKSFYQVSPGVEINGIEQSAIMQRSQGIHEVLLTMIDPELANHLKEIEILPQIFLIRWIRLLFSREFPFEQVLILWDNIFAFDSNLELIDLVCVSMLIRIRWALLEADYSVALQRLLKYPETQSPQSFIHDAVYLKDHISTAGGSSVIMKYTGRAPASISQYKSITPPRDSLQNLSVRSASASGSRTPLVNPSKLFQQHSGNLEAVFQGAASRVIRRSEELGINQAVVSAVSEVRRNLQLGLQDARRSIGSRSDNIFPSSVLSSPATPSTARQPSIIQMARRNRQLAAQLDDVISSLMTITSQSLSVGEDASLKALEAIQTAAAKTQFVKFHLEDSSLELPDIDRGSSQSNAESSLSNPLGIDMPQTPERGDRIMVDAEETTPRIDMAVHTPPDAGLSPITESPNLAPPAVQDHNLDIVESDAIANTTPSLPSINTSTLTQPSLTVPQRRPAPIPTHSTFAKSSFSHMRNPDGTTAADPFSTSSSISAAAAASHSSASASASSHAKQASRERNAFLFGEVTSSTTSNIANPSSSSGSGSRRGGAGFRSEGGGGSNSAGPFTPDDISGLEPIKRRPRPAGGRSGRGFDALFGETVSEG